MTHRHFPGNVVCTHFNVARRLSLARQRKMERKNVIKVVRDSFPRESRATGGTVTRFFVRTVLRFFRLSQTGEESFPFSVPCHERATFLEPFSRLCVLANNVQIATY